MNEHVNTNNCQYLLHIMTDYEMTMNTNLFTGKLKFIRRLLDYLYRKMPKKILYKGRKQEFKILFIYCWIHGMECDNDYWH